MLQRVTCIVQRATSVDVTCRRQDEVAELKVFPPYLEVVKAGDVTGRCASVDSTGSDVLPSDPVAAGATASGLGRGEGAGGDTGYTAAIRDTATAMPLSPPPSPGDASVTVVVQLLDFENPPEIWELVFSEKVARMVELRQRGKVLHTACKSDLNCQSYIVHFWSYLSLGCASAAVALLRAGAPCVSCIEIFVTC